MDDAVIRVNGLGKRYQIGLAQDRHDTLRDAVMARLRTPFFGLRRKGTGQTENLIWALKEVSFDVKRGEVLGIIGRNGAGKTTLLKVLSRITKPTQGTADIYGRVGSLLEVGTGFHAELTGRENIYLNGAILGMKRTEINRKFDEIVAFSEIEKFLDTPVKRYSSGMYVRLAFSVAAHLEPDILLIDEVLAVGDVAFQRKCLEKMEAVAGRGRTVLFVSHNMRAVKSLCHSAIVLEGGEIAFRGPVDEAIGEYLNIVMGEGERGKLDPGMRQVNTGELWIDQIDLVNGNGQSVSQLRIASNCAIIIRFKVRKRVQNIRIGLGFNTLDGARIATLHHTDEGQALFSGEPGFYEMILKLKNPLLSGSYTLSVGAHRALGGEVIDYVPQALRFDVLDVSAEASQPETHNLGLVRFEAEWLPVREVEDV